MAELPKKKRRWDDAAPVATTKVDKSSDITSQLLSIAQNNDITEPTPFQHDIEINGSPARSYLTRGQSCKDIQDVSGAKVVVRGAYHPSHVQVSDPSDLLHLHIEAPTEASLHIAIEEIESIMKEQKNATSFTCKLYVDLPEDYAYKTKGKIVGPSGTYIKYIQKKTNCRVQLRGRGSGFKEGVNYVEADEPMHIYIIAQNDESLEQARIQSEDLLKHVREEMKKIIPPNKFYGHGNAPPPPPPGTSPIYSIPPPPSSRVPPPPPSSAPTRSGAPPPPPPPSSQYSQSSYPGTIPPPPSNAMPPSNYGYGYGYGYGYQGYQGYPQDQVNYYQTEPPSRELTRPEPTDQPPLKKHKTDEEEEDPLDPSCKNYNKNILIRNPQESVTASLKRKIEITKETKNNNSKLFNIDLKPEKQKYPENLSQLNSRTTDNGEGEPFWKYSKTDKSSVFSKLDEIHTSFNKGESKYDDKFKSLMKELE